MNRIVTDLSYTPIGILVSKLFALSWVLHVLIYTNCYGFDNYHSQHHHCCWCHTCWTCVTLLSHWGWMINVLLLNRFVEARWLNPYPCFIPFSLTFPETEVTIRCDLARPSLLMILSFQNLSFKISMNLFIVYLYISLA